MGRATSSNTGAESELKLACVCVCVYHRAQYNTYHLMDAVLGENTQEVVDLFAKEEFVTGALTAVAPDVAVVLQAASPLSPRKVPPPDAPPAAAKAAWEAMPRDTRLAALVHPTHVTCRTSGAHDCVTSLKRLHAWWQAKYTDMIEAASASRRAHGAACLLYILLGTCCTLCHAFSLLSHSLMALATGRLPYEAGV